jgi:hypothetical protein
VQLLLRCIHSAHGPAVPLEGTDTATLLQVLLHLEKAPGTIGLRLSAALDHRLGARRVGA